jgi:bifunctional UDP-N-acetylglucosamine pyrophosphorylase/glucosamine-1-phosphate N-acetyltransferase
LEKIDSNRRKLGVIMGDDVQTGINSMMNVGTILGNHVFLGLGAVASGEITPYSRIL